MVAMRLRGTKQGCEWLIGRWRGLDAALANEGGWDEAQVRLAIDLLGTPVEFRNVPTLLGDDRAALVREQVACLEALKGRSIEDDADDRAAAQLGLEPLEDRDLTLTRRYEKACARRMEWARKQLLSGQAPPCDRTPFVLPPEPPRFVEDENENEAEGDVPPTTPEPLPADRPDVPPAPRPEPVLLDNEGRRARRARLARMLRKG